MKSIVKAAQDLLDALNLTASIPADVSAAANALSDALHADPEGVPEEEYTRLLRNLKAEAVSDQLGDYFIIKQGLRDILFNAPEARCVDAFLGEVYDAGSRDKQRLIQERYKSFQECLNSGHSRMRLSTKLEEIPNKQ